MNTQLFTLSLIEIFLSVFITITVFYITYKILNKLFFKEQHLQKDNLALSIFISGIFLSTGIILSEIVPSITNILRLSSLQPEEVNVFQIIKYSALYLLIGFIVSVIINASVFFLFSILTKGVDEFKEIRNNNIPTALIIVTILISITLIAKDSIALLISSIMPYPEVTNFL